MARQKFVQDTSGISEIMFRISLRLVSDEGDPRQVSIATGLTPDQMIRAGEVSSRTGRPHKFSSWTITLGQKSGSARPEEALLELVSLGLPVAYKLQELSSNDGWEISLIIVQEFRNEDDVAEKGISLGSEVVEWLSVARAGVEIDQYLYH